MGDRHREHRPSLRCDGLEAMLIYSMGVSVDGFIADRAGAFGWTVPSEEQFRFHTAQTRQLGSYLCGRRLYETLGLVTFLEPSKDGPPSIRALREVRVGGVGC
jgi:hypothetical protein